MDDFDLNTPGYNPFAHLKKPLHVFDAKLAELPQVTTVFRIENKNRKGPYAVQGQWQKEVHTPASGRPSPNSDSGFCKVFHEDVVRYGWFDLYREVQTKQMLFGFSSLKQLQAWFQPEELKALEQLGYSISVYENVKGVDSGQQVIFMKD